MSVMKMEVNNMNNTGDGNPVIAGDENEQKSFTSLDELLEQELKDNSVDCFIKTVGDASEESSEFGLNYDERPVVSGSSLKKEFDDTLNKTKEIPVICAANRLECGEEETTKEDKSVVNMSVENTDECTTEIKGEEQDIKPNKNDSDFVQKEDSLITEEMGDELKDEVDEDIRIVENTKEAGNEVHDITEVKLPLEISNCVTELVEEDTDDLSATAESTTEAHEDRNLVFQPKDQASEKNDVGKDIENKEDVQCSETSTTSGNVTTSNTGTGTKPGTKTVIIVGGSSETKNGKDINRSIIVKKVTAKVVEIGNAVVIDPANEHKVNHDMSAEQCVNSVESPESEKQQQDNTECTKEEEPEKEIHNEDAVSVKADNPKVIVTTKVSENSKQEPNILQEKQNSDTDKDSPNMDEQEHHSNVDADHDKTSTLDNEKLPVETKVHNNEEITQPDKQEVNQNEGSESTTKATTFGVVKRKFEEICRISREDEDAAIEEIKKMRKETLDVLQKINAEMGKLKRVYLSGE